MAGMAGGMRIQDGQSPGASLALQDDTGRFPGQPQDTLNVVLTKFQSAMKSHQAFVRHYEYGERSYRGVLVANAEASKWRHKYHPPYAFQLLETIVGNLVDPGLPMDIRPAPRIGLTMQEAQKMLDEVESVRDLLRHEYEVDQMDLKQRPFYLTAALGGRGVLKSYWNYVKGPRTKQTVVQRPVDIGNGNIVHVPTISQQIEKGVLEDRSTCEVVDPRDFIVHESARDLNPHVPGGAQFVIHRCWYSFEQLKLMEEAGFFSNVDSLKDTRDFQQSEYKDRESEVFQAQRRKDLIEVLEYWGMRQGEIQRAYVGNRTVVLRDWEKNPFWHHQYPFVVASSMPQPFSTIGFSDIELVAELQEMLWEIANQRFDNTELINNAIYLFRSDMEDPDSFEFYPGARWLVEDPAMVQALQPPYQLIQATLETEALIKGDLQNITQAAPFAAGAQTQTVDNKTATGATIVMNAAQQTLASKKFYVQQGLRQEAQMRLKNCQQFISDFRLVSIMGPKGQQAFRSVGPLEIQGDFLVSLRLVGESQLRQERRAEASSVLQQLQQVFAQSYISGTPIDMHQVVLWWMRQWDMDDEANAFFEPQTQPDPSLAAMLMGYAPHVTLRGMMGPGQTSQAGQFVGLQGEPGAPGGLPQPGGPNLGVTSGQAVNTQMPSSAQGMSSSPIINMQRIMAARGGWGR
jgi:hypothetical protein